MRLIAFLLVGLASSVQAAPALTSKILNMRLPGHFERLNLSSDAAYNKILDDHIYSQWKEHCIAYEHLYWPISNPQTSPFDVYQNLIGYISPYWFYEEEDTQDKSATAILQVYGGSSTVSVYAAALFTKKTRLDVFLCKTSTAITAR
ncbi:hypothetical protein Q0M94_03430 [Deinococcus radiomollis]|uniref:hypothetical protein n=1 Tax=Deinococcus radiomollis TaxID=468916 RepID=UPI0038913ABD